MFVRPLLRLCLRNVASSERAVRPLGVRAANCAGRRAGVWTHPTRARCTGPAITYPSVVTSGGEHGSCDSKRTSPVLLMAAAAFSLFSKLVEKHDEELTEAEENIVYLLKTAKLSIMKGEMEEAEEILHKTLHLAQECQSKRAVTYTYDLMANLAFVRGNYENAEKLFKTTMVHLLDSGVRQDENSFIEISLKLASIYAARNKKDLAVAGFQFCIVSLDEKIEREKELSGDVLTADERSNTRLLLGLSLDSYARYLVANKQLMHAQTLYEKALQICTEEQGEGHPQTVTLLSDLASVMEAQGRFDEAYAFANQALGLAEKTEHPDHHVILSNLAMILLHQGKHNLMDIERIFKEALVKAEEKKDSDCVRYIQEGLSELSRRKKNQDQHPNV